MKLLLILFLILLIFCTCITICTVKSQLTYPNTAIPTSPAVNSYQQLIQELASESVANPMLSSPISNPITISSSSSPLLRSLEGYNIGGNNIYPVTGPLLPGQQVSTITTGGAATAPLNSNSVSAMNNNMNNNNNPLANSFSNLLNGVETALSGQTTQLPANYYNNYPTQLVTTNTNPTTTNTAIATTTANIPSQVPVVNTATGSTTTATADSETLTVNPLSSTSTSSSIPLRGSAAVNSNLRSFFNHVFGPLPSSTGSNNNKSPPVIASVPSSISVARNPTSITSNNPTNVAVNNQGQIVTV